jgi:hypothetical protein
MCLSSVRRDRHRQAADNLAQLGGSELQREGGLQYDASDNKHVPSRGAHKDSTVGRS